MSYPRGPGSYVARNTGAKDGPRDSRDSIPPVRRKFSVISFDQTFREWESSSCVMGARNQRTTGSPEGMFCSINRDEQDATGAAWCYRAGCGNEVRWDVN